MTVAVLMGGLSGERDISLMSGAGVLAALQAQGVTAMAWDPAERPLAAMPDAGIERVFTVLHGKYGEDGCVQGALELMAMPYTGSGVLASALSMDKVMTKQVWQSLGLPTPAFRALDPHALAAQAAKSGAAMAQLAQELAVQLGLPYIIKPAREGSSLGLAVMRTADADALAKALAQATRGSDAVVAEAMVRGREFTVALLGAEDHPAQPEALPVIEIRAPQGDYDYHNKYFSDDVAYDCPAALPPQVTEEMQAMARAAWHAAGCEGWARVDILWDGASTPQMLEINTAPGMTSHSLVPMAARAVGLSYEQLVLRVLRGARCKMERAA